MKTATMFVSAVTLLGVSAASAVAEEYPMTFEALDRDGSGYLSADEVEVRPDLAAKMQGGDRDGDGQLNSAEFSALEGEGHFSPPEDSEIAEPGAAPY